MILAFIPCLCGYSSQSLAAQLALVRGFGFSHASCTPQSFLWPAFLRPVQLSHSAFTLKGLEGVDLIDGQGGSCLRFSPAATTALILSGLEPAKHSGVARQMDQGRQVLFLPRLNLLFSSLFLRYSLTAFPEVWHRQNRIWISDLT